MKTSTKHHTTAHTNPARISTGHPASVSRLANDEPIPVDLEETLPADPTPTALSQEWQNQPDIIPPTPAPAPGWDRVEPPAKNWGYDQYGNPLETV